MAEAYRVAHLVDGHVELGAVAPFVELFGVKIDMTADREAVVLHSVEVAVGIVARREADADAVRICGARFDDLNVEARAAIPGGSTLVEVAAVLLAHLARLEVDRNPARAVSFPRNLMVARVLIFELATILRRDTV